MPVFYVATETKYGFSFWCQIKKEYGCKHFATMFATFAEASGGMSNAMRYMHISSGVDNIAICEESDGIIKKVFEDRSP